MAIKSGQILHDAYGFVIDRIQTAGVGNVNIPQEKIYELGNYQTVATVRDIPDLSFDLESLDMSCEIEALLTNADPGSLSAGQKFEFTKHVPLDIISPFKSGNGAFDIVKGLAVPYLTLESAGYRFGVGQSGSQQFSLRGDSIYYVPGAPVYEEFAAAGTGPYTLTDDALAYQESGTTIYVLGVCYVTSTGAYKRLFHGSDYSDTSTAFTLAVAPPAGSTIRVVYGTDNAKTYNQAVHQDATVKPAAIRAKDIDVYVQSDPSNAASALTRWASVQSFEANWRVNLDNDEEFGNTHYVAQDYDQAEVNGSVTIKPRDMDDLFTRIRQIAGLTATNEVIGALSSKPLKMELRVNHPDTGARIKTLYIPDARFTVPAVQGRVQQKLETQLSWESDSGVIEVYNGARP